MEGEIVLSYDPDKNGARDVMKVIVRGLFGVAVSVSFRREGFVGFG